MTRFRCYRIEICTEGEGETLHLSFDLGPGQPNAFDFTLPIKRLGDYEVGHWYEVTLAGDKQ